MRWRRVLALLSLSGRRAAALGPALGRREMLLVSAGSAVAPTSAGAMWQMWQPSDMLSYVDQYSVRGDAESVLKAMDKCAETSWMMNMGKEKGELLEEAFRTKKRILEIGTFLSYSTMRIARSMPADARLLTVEIDSDNYKAAREIMERALPESVLKRVEAVNAPADKIISQRTKPFDAVLMDHWKADYAKDLEALVKRGLLQDGALVVADNVLFPGAPELLDYLRVPFDRAQDDVSGQPCLLVKEDREFRSPNFMTTLVRSPFEYRPETPDGLTFSTYIK